jgi:hypothetical protein
MRFPIAAVGLVLTGCYTSGEGISPPLDRIYFPVALATDCDSRARDPAACEAKRLYVVSSDFDLQFNAGSLQVLNLDVVRRLVDTICPAGASDAACLSGSYCTDAGLAVQDIAERATVPGPCTPLELNFRNDSGEKLLFDTVGIGAFATDAILTSKLDGTKKRLLVPARGESSLHWIDLEDSASGNEGALRCGQTEGSRTCDRRHRVGTESTENSRGARMPPEPYGIAATDEGDAIVVTHQTEGKLSLFTQDVVTDDGWEMGPHLDYVHQLPAAQAVAIAAAPGSSWVRQRRSAWLESGLEADLDPFPPGFLVVYGGAPRLDLVRYYADTQSSPARPYLQEVQSLALHANSGDRVSRGIAYDESQRRACERLHCDSTDLSGIADLGGLPTECGVCEQQSIGVYVSNRSPASLIVGRTMPWAPESPSRDAPAFDDVFPVPPGPSRVYVGKVVGETGQLETRIFEVSFDQRRITIFDPRHRRIEAFITTGRGPHSMAFDFRSASTDTGQDARALAYVGHFTDSYVGVVELDRRKVRTYGTIVLSIARAIAPRASK